MFSRGKYEALDGEGDKCNVFEFAFSRFTTTLALNEVNTLIGEQVLSLLKDGFDEVCYCYRSIETRLICDRFLSFFRLSLLLNLLQTIYQQCPMK